MAFCVIRMSGLVAESDGNLALTGAGHCCESNMVVFTPRSKTVPGFVDAWKGGMDLTATLIVLYEHAFTQSTVWT